MNVLVTGAAGFIGSHVSRWLLERGDAVVGLDNLSPYYSVELKRARLDWLAPYPNFHFVELDIVDQAGLTDLFSASGFDGVVHLAAQAGVRYSIREPHTYAASNLTGFLNVLEACRHSRLPHLVYASSSSVHGANAELPFSVRQPADHPVSFYGATKKANELMAHSYSYLYGLPTTGLRFFTVYGPWGRPDMAIFLFTRAILRGEPIDVFNHGAMRRDFTYIDDVAEGVLRTLDSIPAGDPDWADQGAALGRSSAPYRVYNIGNHSPVELTCLIEVLEAALGKKAERRLMPMQPGDVPATYADVDDLARDVGFQPSTPIDVGVRRFVEWYLGFYGAEPQ